MKPLKMYACFDPKGEPMSETLENLRRDSVWEAENIVGVWWRTLKERGYKCEQVEVTIKKL